MKNNLMLLFSKLLSSTRIVQQLTPTEAAAPAGILIELKASLKGLSKNCRKFGHFLKYLILPIFKDRV